MDGMEEKQEEKESKQDEVGLSTTDLTISRECVPPAFLIFLLR